MAETETEAVFRRFYVHIWNEGDIAVADELLVEIFANHAVADAPASHRVLHKRGVVGTRIAYLDWPLIIEDLFAEDDWVTARWREHGTHRLGRGGAPDREESRVLGNTIVCVINGRIAEF